MNVPINIAHLRYKTKAALALSKIILKTFVISFYLFKRQLVPKNDVDRTVTNENKNGLQTKYGYHTNTLLFSGFFLTFLAARFLNSRLGGVNGRYAKPYVAASFVAANVVNKTPPPPSAPSLHPPPP